MGAGRVAVLDGVIMDVVAEGLEFPLVTDHVLPEAMLPDTALSLANTAGVGGSFGTAGGHEGMGKAGFDHSPTGREIGVAAGEGPDGMDMLGKHNGGVDGERVTGTRIGERPAKDGDGVRGTKDRPAVESYDREIERAARFECPTILRHSGYDSRCTYHGQGKRRVNHPPYTLHAHEEVADYFAVGNLSKFSLKRQRNHNVDVRPDNLQESTAYLQHDLEVLAPRYIINASGKPFPFAAVSTIISIPQYTHSQLGFYRLRSKVSEKEVSAFRPVLQQIMNKYKRQLPYMRRKISNEIIKSDDFVRYFRWAYKITQTSVPSPGT